MCGQISTELFNTHEQAYRGTHFTHLPDRLSLIDTLQMNCSLFCDKIKHSHTYAWTYDPLKKSSSIGLPTLQCSYFCMSVVSFVRTGRHYTQYCFICLFECHASCSSLCFKFFSKSCRPIKQLSVSAAQHLTRTREMVIHALLYIFEVTHNIPPATSAADKTKRTP